MDNQPASSDHPKLRRHILYAGVCLAVLWDSLLREAPWAINITLWTLAFTAAWFILRRKATALRKTDAVLIALLILFSALPAWRDSEVLRGLDLLFLSLVVALLLLSVSGLRVLCSGVFAYPAGLILAVLHAAIAAPVTAFEIPWRELRGESERPSRVLPILRSLLLTVPLLVLFGTLLAAADARFELLMRRIFNIDSEQILIHSFTIALASWVSVGLLRGTVIGSLVPMPQKQLRSPLKIGVTELAIALGMLDILFLSFILVQSSYFFGGAALVHETEGLTLAEFARRGFFELVAVALLLVLVLLLFDWIRPTETRRERKLFHVLAGCAVLLILPIIASAMHRMLLYRAQFGLTQLRLYTTAFMLWLVVVFVWFVVTVLRDRRERFAFGAFLSACLTIVALHAINPDAVIVRTNIARGFEGRELDASYLTILSWDAAPAILESIQYAPEPAAGILRTHLTRRANQKRDDWRTWSYGYLQGRAAVAGITRP